MNIFFKFNKGTYSTSSKFLHHDWYLAQIEVSSNIVFKSARFYTSLFERLMDETGRTITASDFRKIRQKALAKELLKPKYQAYGFRTADLLKNLPDHFRNPAQIRYEMNKMKARDVVLKPNNKLFYMVTETGWKCLWLEICSANHLKNPMILRIIKNHILKIAEHPSQIEKAYELIQFWLFAGELHAVMGILVLQQASDASPPFPE